MLGPLRRRLLAARDVLLALALCLAGEFELASAATYDGRPVWPGPRLATALIIPLLTLPLVWRRRRPLAVCLFVLCIAGVSSAVMGGGEATTEFVVFIVAAFTGAAYTDRVGIIVVAALGAGAVHELRDPSVNGVGDVVWAAGMLTVATLLGRAVYVRQHRIGVLQDEATLREQQHARQVTAATAAERAAIARELHDIVAHAVSVVVIQSQAGARALPHRPEDAAQTLATIETTARTALNDLRRLLTVLSAGDDEHSSPRPLGSLSQLGELAATFQRSGLDVQLRAPTQLPQLTPAAELAIYRVVQEALTNAARYARGSSASVTLQLVGASLTVEVLNSSGEVAVAGLGAGRGLIGMHERLDLVGGTLAHARTPDGGYVVAASIPLAENEVSREHETVA